MKKFVKFMTALLALVMTGSLVVGCAKNAGGEDPTPAADDGTIVVNDFENFIEDFAPMSVFNYIGKININRDDRYVLSGKASARIDLIGDTELTKSNPGFKVPLVYNKRGENHSDLSDVVMIESNFYNASDVDITVSVALTGTANQDTVLTAGEWTSAMFVVDRATLAIRSDLTKDFKDITYSFKAPDSPKVLYLDKIVEYTTDEPYNKVEMTFDEGEVAFFEKPWQQYAMITAAPSNASEYYKPSVSLNSDSRYAKSGNSLRADFPGNTGDVASDVWAYSYVTFGSRMISESGLQTLGKFDTASFDIYNPGNEQIRLFVTINSIGGGFVAKANGVYVPAGSWKTVSFTGVDLTTGTLMNEKISGAKANGAQNIESVSISFEVTRSQNKTYTVYIDNFGYSRGMDIEEN